MARLLVVLSIGFILTTLSLPYVTPKCNGGSDTLSERYGPLYGKKMEENSADDGETYWFLIWGEVINKTQTGHIASARYEVKLSCYLPYPRRIDNRTETMKPIISMSTMPDRCFAGPGLHRHYVFLVRSGSPPNYFIMTAAYINAPSDTPEGISTWLALTNLCPIWHLKSVGNNCPNMKYLPRQAYHVPPGCFNDLSTSRLEKNGAAAYLYEVSTNCSRIGPDSMTWRTKSNALTVGSVQYTVFGQLNAVNYAEREFEFQPYCFMSNHSKYTPSIPMAPRVPFKAFFPEEYNGCFPFDEESAKSHATYIVFIDENYQVRAAAIKAEHEHFKLLASDCSSNVNTRMVLAPGGDEFCQPLFNRTTVGCYNDLSISAAVSHKLAISTTECEHWPCTNFTQAYKAAIQVFWATVGKISEGAEPGEVVAEIFANCKLKQHGPAESDVTRIIVSDITTLMEPIIPFRDYIFAIKQRRVRAGVQLYEVISPPIPATKNNWLSLCTSCAVTDMPHRYAGYPDDYYSDHCSVDVCYYMNKPPSPWPPSNCKHHDLTSFICHGSSDSLSTRFDTSTMVLYGQVSSTHSPRIPKALDTKENVLVPHRHKVVEMTKTNRELHVEICPLCQLKGKSSDLGPLPTVHIKFDGADCFNVDNFSNPMFPNFEKYERYFFFLDAQTATATAVPILSQNNEAAMFKLMASSCAIEPPDFPVVGVGRVQNIDLDELGQLCPVAKRQQYCTNDFSIANISKTFVEAFQLIANSRSKTVVTHEASNWNKLPLILSCAILGVLFLLAVGRFVGKRIRARRNVQENNAYESVEDSYIWHTSEPPYLPYEGTPVLTNNRLP